MKIINRTTRLIEDLGRRKRAEISVKRRFIQDWNTKEWREIQRNPEDAKIYHDYRFEIINHDLHLAFAPSDKRLPFLRITDPISKGIWVLWFIGWDDFTPENPICPQLIDRGEGFVEWRLDETTRFRVEILGHLIRKLIIVERHPVWNRLQFRIGRANALLIDGAGVGVKCKRLIAFRKDASWKDNPIFWFSEPKAWDSQADIPATVEPDYILTPITDALWDMEIALDPDWLDNVQYPVYIDPTIVLQPDAAEGKDARILAVKPDYNEGGTVYLSTNYSGDNNKQHTVIEFDLSSIPSGATINDATLRLWQGVYGVNYHQVIVSRVTAYWKEMEVTWNNRLSGVPWETPGGDHSSDYWMEPSRNNNQEVLLDGTAIVQDWVNGVDNYGFHLRDDCEGNYGHYNSSDAADDENAPKLTIDYAEGGIFIPAKLGSLAGKGSITPLASA